MEFLHAVVWSGLLVKLGMGLAVFHAAHLASYRWLKGRILRSRTWDLNICCGRTDGGGVNADIRKHAEVPNFVEITDVTRLPFADRSFHQVLCSHTLEHVDDPRACYDELRRVGRHVTLVLPPLWDLFAACNVLEHQWLFLTFRKRHATLPPYVRLPFARWIRERWGFLIRA